MNFKLLLIKLSVFFVIGAIAFGCATKYGAHFQRTSEHDKRFQRTDHVNSNEKLLSIKEDIPVNPGIENESESESDYNNDQTGAVASIRKEPVIGSPIKEYIKKYEQRIESVKGEDLDNRSFDKEVRKARKELNKEIKNELKSELIKVKKDYKSYKKSVKEKDASAKVVNKWVYIGLVVGAGGLVLLIFGVGTIGAIGLVVGVGFIVYGLLLNAGVI